MSIEELDAFIAVLYARGIYGASKFDLHSLWSKPWGPPFFTETMSRDRFSEIMRFLRFDIKQTRSFRLQSDKFALASEVWYKFINNSILCYKPGEYITIDEQLFPTKARCRFTQYIASKPDKYGIKFWLAVDIKSKYLVNGFPYLGKDETRPSGQSLGENVVLRLIEPYKGKGRNVTTDNFFTSLKLAHELKKKNVSLVGTMNRRRREVPTSATETTSQLYSTKLYTCDDISLTSYRCKPKKNVIILSSMHPDISVGSDEKQKPETIDFYNSTKYGVDVVDQMTRKYTVKAGSRRWPMQVFYNVLDLAAINAWILFNEVSKKNIARR